MLKNDDLSWTLKHIKVAMQKILTEGIQKIISKIDEDLETKVKCINYFHQRIQGYIDKIKPLA